MNIFVSDAALQWFKEEMGLTNGDKIKFYSQIYGSSPVQKGYALGFTKDNEPIDMAVCCKAGGIDFYVESGDVWFFDGHDLHVDYDPDADEIRFKYTVPQ